MDYRSLAMQQAQRFGVDPALFQQLITAESNWNPNAVSPVGARGLAQIMPGTGRDPGFGIAPVQWGDPNDELRFGAQYLSTMLQRYNGDVNRALAAYNWGPGNADRWNGSLDSLPEETRNYILKIRGAQPQGMGGGLTMSTKGALSQGDDMIVTRNLDGLIPPEEIARLAGGAIARANTPQMAAGAPVGPTMTPFMPASQPALAMDPSQAPVDQSNGAAEGGVMGYLKGLIPDLNNPDDRQNLLAIGAGLLAGEDWSDGFAKAGVGLMEAGAQRQDRDARMDQIMTQGMLDMERTRLAGQMSMEEAMLRSSMPTSTSFERVGSVMTPDGQVVGGVSYDPSTAQYFTIDPTTNQRMDLPGAIPLNNSDASGSRFFTQAIKERDAATSAATTLRTIDRVISRLDSTPTGIQGAVSDLQRAYNTLLNKGITPEQMARGLNQADMSALVGQLKDEVVGPGVMTEQDAARIVLAAGGDLRSILTNPEILREQLNTLRTQYQGRYDRHYGQYTTFQTTFPTLTLEPLERYSPEATQPTTTTAAPGDGALNSSNAGEGLPVPQGVDPELWQLLTPEEQREFIGG